MLDHIRDKHPGSLIAIIGSAPSAIHFEDRGYDATVAVNGAAQLLHRAGSTQYFLSGDARATRASWYKRLPSDAIQILRPMAAIYSPTFIRSSTRRHELIRQWEDYLDTHPEEVRTIPHRNVMESGDIRPLRDLIFDNPFYDTFLADMPDCTPHIAFNVTESPGVLKTMNKLRGGATSAGCALHAAHIMGASEVHLYGVEMSNLGIPYASGNYFYAPQQGETGGTSLAQIQKLNRLLADVASTGVTIRHFGPTNLEAVSYH